MFSLTLMHRLNRLRLSMLFTHSPSPSRDLVVDLTSGQQEVLELRRGETVLVLRGAATLHHPTQWLGETLVRHGTELGEGEAHFAGEAQVVTLVARSATRVRRLGSSGGVWMSLGASLSDSGTRPPAASSQSAHLQTVANGSFAEAEKSCETGGKNLQSAFLISVGLP